jgi:hypothetical protein
MLARATHRRGRGPCRLTLLALPLALGCVADQASEGEESIGQSADALRSTSTPGKAVWTKVYPAIANPATADAVGSDEDGNAYAMLTLGDARDLGDGMPSAGSVLAKYDGYGTLGWSRSLGDMPRSFDAEVSSRAGLVAVAGSYYPPGGASPQAGWLVVHDAGGGFRFRKQFVTTGDVWISGVAVGPDGSVVIAGGQDGGVDYGGGVLGHDGGRDGFVAKFSSAGAHQWSHLYGGSNYQATTGVAVDGTGAVYLTGVFTGNVDLGGGALVDGEPASTYGTEDVFLAKLTTDGAHVWSKSFPGYHAQSTQSIAVTNGGRIALLGTFTGDVDFGCGKMVDGNTNIYTEAREIFVAKLSSGGTCAWSRHFAGQSVRHARGVAIDSTYGDVTMTVTFAKRMSVDDHDYYSGGTANMILAKFYATDGHTMFSKHYGSTGNIADPRAVAVVPTGRILTVGSFSGSVDFGRGPVSSGGAPAGFLTRFHQ